MAGGGHFEGFCNYKAFILLLSNSGQSQLHFGTKFILVGACVAKIRLNFDGKSRKLIF